MLTKMPKLHIVVKGKFLSCCDHIKQHTLYFPLKPLSQSEGISRVIKINVSYLQPHPQAGRRRPWGPLQKQKHTRTLTINHVFPENPDETQVKPSL